MKKSKILKVIGIGCVLALLAGCGSKALKNPPVLDEASENARTDVGNESQSYLTVAQAKALVLENAGLLEEDVRFVRVNLDTASGAARYDIEFISETAEYDYGVDALTGEILSMISENGSYDMENVPEETIRAAGEQPKEEQPEGGQTQEEQSERGQTEEEQQYIGVEEAKRLALEHAGLQDGEVRFAHAHLEFDDGCWQYDVEFHKDSTEYDYNVDARSGKIISYDHDAEYYRAWDKEASGSEQITEEQAKKIALEHAGVAETEAEYLTVEFDYDDGRAEYQVEWYVGRMEYSCDVDAGTGKILSFEKERD